MAQFKIFENGMEVNGITIMSVVNGLGSFKSLAQKYLRDAGLANVVASETAWFSQEDWLKAFEKISEELGDSTLFAIGKQIPENAIFPKEIDSVDKALDSIDVAYHMNHRNARGEVLFDPARTGKPIMLEGIGHYKFQKVANENKAIMLCENPYPCAFDRGIIETMARKFQPTAKVEHDDSKPCRKKGSHTCTYTVTWR